jgi:hypothetical protein
MIKTGRVINKEEMSVKSIIAETLISKGVGHILPSSYLKKATTELGITIVLLYIN